jgi:hypothetical protein
MIFPAPFDAYFQFAGRRIAYPAIMPQGNRSATRTFLPLLIAFALMVLVVGAAWAAPF